MRYHWFIQFSHERKPSLESRRSAPASKLSISSLGARHKLEHKAISPIDVAPALRTIVRRLYRVIIYNNNGPQREKTGSYLPVTGLASTNWVPDWLGRSIKVISRVRACNTQPPWRTWWYAQQPPMNFACNPNEIRARAKRNRKESWRNIISTMITMTIVSFPKFLRKLERRVFHAVSRRNYRRILLLKPLHSPPCPYVRLLERVFRHVVAVCSTIITAIWTIQRTGTVHRSLALFTRNYLFDRDGRCAQPPRVSPL